MHLDPAVDCVVKVHAFTRVFAPRNVSPGWPKLLYFRLQRAVFSNWEIYRRKTGTLIVFTKYNLLSCHLLKLNASYY